MCSANQVIRSFSLLIFLAVLFIAMPVEAGGLHKKKKIQKIEKSQKKPKKTISPKTATLMAIVPGLGQIYNHKIWKVPIVYAGFAVFGYFIVTNTKYYHTFRDAYNATYDSTTTNPYALRYSRTALRTVRDYYRRNMQLSYILSGAWYILQMIDANVDAHLTHWNISSNLSMEVSPVIMPPVKRTERAYNGISLRFRF